MGGSLRIGPGLAQRGFAGGNGALEIARVDGRTTRRHLVLQRLAPTEEYPKNTKHNTRLRH